MQRAQTGECAYSTYIDPLPLPTPSPPAVSHTLKQVGGAPLPEPPVFEKVQVSTL